MTESALLKNAAEKASIDLPRQSAAVREYAEKLHVVERERIENLDSAANLTGAMLSELFDWNRDEYSQDLKGLGFSLGKFIYLCDCFEDISHDKRKNNYNPLIPVSEEMLSAIMYTGTQAFERLPLLEDVEILRNILYSGIWQRFEIAAQKMGDPR